MTPEQHKAHTNVGEGARTDDALRESEERYRELVAQVTDYAIFRMDPQGRPVTWNEGVERVLGFKQDEFIGADITCIFTPEAIAAGVPQQELREAAQTGSAGDDRWMRRKTGERFYAQGVTNVLRNEQGQVTGYTKILRDDTDLWQAEEALRRSEARYRSLFESIDEGFCVFDMIYDDAGRPVDYRFVEVNPAFERHTGLAQAEGRTIRELVPDHETHWFEIYGNVASTGESVRFENRGEGMRRWFSVYAFRVGEAKNRRVAAIFTDITHRKQVEQALNELNESLEQRVADRTAEVERQSAQLRALASQLSDAEQRERKRLANVLHDHIQQLIVGAKFQLVSVKHTKDSERVSATIDRVNAVLDEAQTVTRSLAVELNPPALQENGLIGGVKWLVARMQEQHHFHVRLRAQPEAEPATEELRYVLFECVRELLLNATKYAGVREADVWLKRVPGNSIQIIVQDKGKGFDPDQVMNRRIEESSFGLFSIQQRLAHLRGSIEIESAPGRGTVATIVVPPEREHVTPTPEESVAAGGTATMRLRRKPEACRLLVVDDHQMLREGLVGLLDYESDLDVVGQVGDGAQAVALAAELKPDVVLMDVDLGGTDSMNGIEATRQILARNPDVKIIGLSMHADPDVAAAMRAAGAVAYVTKVNPRENLVETIRKVRAG